MFSISQIIFATSIFVVLIATETFAKLTIRTDIEPSDVLFKNGKIYVVDDGGGILSMNVDGTNKRYMSISGEPDLESIANIPSESAFAYIGRESPAEILKILLATGSIKDRIALPRFPNDGDSGMESLFYMAKFDVILAGSQGDGYVYLFKKNSSNKRTLYCRFRPYIGPKADLSAITSDGNILSFMYDSAKTIIMFDISKITTTNICSMASKANYKFKRSPPLDNMEGIAFSPTHVFIAQDSGNVVRYTRAEFARF